MLRPKPQLNLQNAREYFREHLCVGDYYSEGQKVTGEWLGVGAERLGLKRMVGGFENRSMTRSAKVFRKLEVLLGECPARCGLQISLERGRPPTIGERDCGFDPPWLQLRCVQHPTGVVIRESVFQVVG